MPRRLRLEFEGAIYQVTAWGNARQKIVRDVADRQRLMPSNGPPAWRPTMVRRGRLRASAAAIAGCPSLFTSGNDVHDRRGTDEPREGAAIKVNGKLQRTRKLRRRHSDRGRAESASGKAGTRHAQRPLGSGGQLDLRTRPVVGRRCCRRASEAHVDQEPVARIEPWL
jgi:hypothetical protein